MTSLFSFVGDDGPLSEGPASTATQLFRWVGIPCIGLLIWLSCVISRNAACSEVLIAMFTRLISLKVLLGTVLSTFAIQRQGGMASREHADQVNSFGRKPIAENLQEEVSSDFGL
jgi:hypothetical protein